MPGALKRVSRNPLSLPAEFVALNNGAIEALQLALRPLLGAVIGTLPQPLRAPAAEAGGKPNGVVDDLQETVGRVFTPRRVLTGGNENSERGATLTGRQGSGPAALP